MTDAKEEIQRNFLYILFGDIYKVRWLY